jgi:SAM-dependent methyltransferase
VSEDFHRGLAATLFDLFNNDDDPEVGYLCRVAEQSGEPVLDLGCGPGRLLRQFLKAGLDADGCDISPDMLAICRTRAAADGLEPVLYEQSMAELDLPRRYRTIVLCGSLGLGGTHADDLEALRRIFDHLEPDGLVAIDHYQPWSDSDVWQLYGDGEIELPTPWTRHNPWMTTEEGDRLLAPSRVVELDPVGLSFVKEVRYDLYREKRLVAREVHRLTCRWYFLRDLERMLADAGFRDIRIHHDYTVRHTRDRDVSLFTAKR